MFVKSISEIFHFCHCQGESARGAGEGGDLLLPEERTALELQSCHLHGQGPQGKDYNILFLNLISVILNIFAFHCQVQYLIYNYVPGRRWSS